jgi:acyl-CoA thioesterase I
MINTLALRRVAMLSGIVLALTVAYHPLSAQQRTPSTAAGTPKAVEAPKAAEAAKCAVQPDIARFDQRLSRVALRLSGGVPIKIVAIGSSSTAGAGASSPANTYPSRLEAELRQHFPGHPITVVNRGVNGEEATDMLARFDTSVIAETVRSMCARRFCRTALRS